MPGQRNRSARRETFRVLAVLSLCTPLTHVTHVEPITCKYMQRIIKDSRLGVFHQNGVFIVVETTKCNRCVCVGGALGCAEGPLGARASSRRVWLGGQRHALNRIPAPTCPTLPTVGVCSSFAAHRTAATVSPRMRSHTVVPHAASRALTACGGPEAPHAKP